MNPLKNFKFYGDISRKYFEKNIYFYRVNNFKCKNQTKIAPLLQKKTQTQTLYFWLP